MNSGRFEAITGKYPSLRIAVVGDFCLDRYLEIDPTREEISLETQLPVYNVVRVRASPGAAGTIVNNLSALGVGSIHPVGFVGEDGEGYELSRALASLPGVKLDHLLQTGDRRTFTYCKPLIVRTGESPRELSRLDSKNWTTTPAAVQQRLVSAIRELSQSMNAIIVMDQVDVAETGVVTRLIRQAVHEARRGSAGLVILADSRRGLAGFPAVGFKMNASELAVLTGTDRTLSIEEVQQGAVDIASRNLQPVFVTLAERGVIGASADGDVEHVPAFPVRGPVDIVGAGDSVTANIAAALATGAEMREAMLLAMAAASVVIHQLGRTGTANLADIASLVCE